MTVKDDRYLDINIDTGADFSLTFTLYRTGSTPVDLTDAIVNAELRDYPEGETSTMFTAIHNGEGGAITIRMPHETSAALGFPYGTYNVVVTFPDGAVEDVLHGKAFISENVTRLINKGDIYHVIAFDSFDDFPAEGNLYRIYLDREVGALYFWNGTQYISLLNALKGDAATIRIGTTITGEPGTNAEVTNSGTIHDAIFNFRIPRGQVTGDGAEALMRITTSQLTSITEDTPTYFKNQGNRFWYITPDLMTDQPTPYGLLYNIVYSGGLVSQVWIEPYSGQLYTRAGDNNGWHSNGWIRYSSSDEPLMKRVAYHNETTDGVLDALTDGTALVLTSPNVNASLYNALGDNYSYVMQMGFGNLSATSKRIQIAYPYNNTIAKFAYRIYTDGWGNWNVIDMALLGNYLPLTGGTLSGHLIFGGNNKCVRFIPDDTTTLQFVQTTLRNNGRLCVWYRTAGAGSELFEFPAVDASATGNNYYDVLTSKTPVTIAQGGTGAKTAIGALANLGAVNKAGDTVTGSIIYKNSEMDIAANSLPNAVYASTYIIRDTNNQNVAYLETSQATTGEVALNINVARKNASGTRVENNISLSVAKDGTRNVKVSDAAAWRSAIGAVNKAGDTMTGALIVKGDGASLEAYNANNKRGFGIYMNANGTSFIRSYNVSTGYAINFNLPTPLDSRTVNQGLYLPAMKCGTAALTSGTSVMDNNTIYLQYE